MGNFDHANETASSSIEIDGISVAFHRTKESFESDGRDRSSKINHDGQDKLDRTDDHERIDRNEIDESNTTKKNRKSNHSNGPILAIEFDADDGQFRCGVRRNENGSSSIEIEYFRHFMERFSNPMAAIDDPGPITMAKTSGTEPTITNEPIEEKSMNPT